MSLLLASNWWSLVIRGLVAILLGILALAWPGITLSALVLLFGAYALVDGVVNLAGAWRASKAHERWGVLVIEGVAGIVAGLVTFAWPAITALALIYVIAAWAVVTGILEIAAATKLRKHISGEWLLALSGVASIIFGILLMAYPLAGALVIAIWFGVYAIVFGAMLVGLGFRLRTWAKTIGGTSAAVGIS
ncbi:MAG: HdeD family acid-resistance protein [Acidobacteriaceae bacterium]|nr:HdeD family acid-resistance protein [Acidobacteriaceae bacterium]